jgi:hypothetical protein
LTFRLGTMFVLISHFSTVFFFFSRFVTIQIQCRFNNFSIFNVANPGAWLFQTFKFYHINYKLCH